MADERWEPPVPDMPTGYPGDVRLDGGDGGPTSLHLADGAREGMLEEAAETAARHEAFQRLLTVLHAVRGVRLVELDTQEHEVVKTIAEADTEELRLPRVLPVSPPKPRSGRRRTKKISAQQGKDDARRREVEGAQEASRRLHKRDRFKGGP